VFYDANYNMFSTQRCLMSEVRHAAPADLTNSNVNFTDRTQSVRTANVTPSISATTVQIDACVSVIIRLSRIPIRVSHRRLKLAWSRARWRHSPDDLGVTVSAISRCPVARARVCCVWK